MRNTRVLMLNADFRPLGMITWQRAMVLAYLHQEDVNAGAEVIEYYNDEHIKSAHGQHLIPAVMRSITYIRKKDNLPFSKKNVFMRDGLTCMYCGKQFPIELLSFDHVIPRKLWKGPGTPTNFLNIVTACIACNRKKADKTPKQAKMTLLREPKVPNSSGYVLGLSPWSKIHPKWIPYLPQIYVDLYNKCRK